MRTRSGAALWEPMKSRSTTPEAGPALPCWLAGGRYGLVLLRIDKLIPPARRSSLAKCAAFPGNASLISGLRFLRSSSRSRTARKHLVAVLPEYFQPASEHSLRTRVSAGARRETAFAGRLNNVKC
jgi:hypothetical protein